MNNVITNTQNEFTEQKPLVLKLVQLNGQTF